MKKAELKQLIKECIIELNESLDEKIINKFNKKYLEFIKYFKKNKYKKNREDIKSAIYNFGYENNIDFDRYVDEFDYLTDDIIEKIK